MKNLFVAVICLLILIVPWLIYDRYSTESVENYNYILENEVIPAVSAEDWTKAGVEYDKILDEWKRFESISEYFLDMQAVNEASELIYKTRSHIAMHDKSNAAACSAELVHLLRYLHENELLSAGNIF